MELNTDCFPDEQCTQIDTSNCCGRPEIKHSCSKDFITSMIIEGIPFTVKKTGFGTGATKQEACNAALSDAQDQAAKLLALVNDN